MSISAAGSNRSVMRSLEVFEAYRLARGPLSLSELASATGIPASTCHGVMRTLEQNGFLYFVGHDAYPTRRLWDIADEIRLNDPIVRRVEPVLTALRDEVDETVVLGTRQGDSVLFLLVLESRQSIRYSARASERKPLHSSAIGKAILASLPQETLSQWLATRPLARVTERTITGPAQLLADIEESRARGYFVSRGENAKDVMAIAARLSVGVSEVGVAITGPIHRMDAIEAKLGDRLRHCVRQLEQRDLDGR